MKLAPTYVLAWAVNEGYFPPVGSGEPGWFKRQIVSAAISASKEIKQRWPEATIICAEPLIHVAPRNRRRPAVRAAEQNRGGMFEAYDWIMGRDHPELGANGLIELKWSPPKLDAKASGPIRYPIADFFLTNAICRNSPTMRRCSEELVQGVQHKEAAE